MKGLILTLALMALPVSAAQAGGSQGGTAASMSTTMIIQMQSDMRARMQPMMDDLRRLSGTAFDRAFFSMMIPHHQSAIEMSRAALPRLRDPLVRAWAQSIIDDQQKEIAEMQAELQRLGGVDTARQNRMRQAMSAMGQMMTQMMSRSQSPDHAFLEMMTPHHGSANEMANIALQNGQTDHVLSIAQRIMMAQADEMHDFKDWLRTHQ
ncbi:hypothetical protein DAERI_020017 [Deinococcus aerius]|uniref:DUF305 domain-containing protein n=2 Tax=Deinococcus TaxID=1298 RepID=A0A2I9D2S8_9DEIO|nr:MULTISPECIES: DUF305 domain-containing protein [Deinococcus]MBB5293702.1 uncharacterized protein (DUF305 family) [Deinococcus metallilatus]QBY07330.1 DUF305 domain-containing protein [Deinococcus metallilatus]RXJ14803.1 DUF305 domain-containing protein [Deinococcus metallilatus]TLK30924.1 DUF305 domain-containing protein [Deinococcus metallilatus]GBF04420.1 hypothetical protein DAERI_020017 [Deinococcus aerius]